MENYNECYHCGPVHPELCELVPAFKQGGGRELDWDNGVPHRDGRDHVHVHGDDDACSRSPDCPRTNACATRAS